MSKYSYISNLRAIEEYIKDNVDGELFVFSGGKRINEIISIANRREISVNNQEKKDFSRLFGFLKSEKVFPLVLKIKETDKKVLSFDTFLEGIKGNNDPLCVLILDQIKDPQNLGNIMRTCDQFAIDLIIVPEKRSVRLTDTVRNVSVGAYKFVNLVYYQNVSVIIKKLKENDFWVYSSDIEGESIVKTNFGKRVCIIMGSEDQGIRNNIISESDEVICIPSLGNIDSHNLATATAIVLYEIRKKQGII